MSKRKINILCLQEIKWVREKSTEIKVNGSKLWYTKKVNGRNDVGVIVDKEWRQNIVGVERIEDCIMCVKATFEKTDRTGRSDRQTAQPLTRAVQVALWIGGDIKPERE